eukprot:775987-Rhodomonas_salina.1
MAPVCIMSPLCACTPENRVHHQPCTRVHTWKPCPEPLYTRAHPTATQSPHGGVAGAYPSWRAASGG